MEHVLKYKPDNKRSKLQMKNKQNEMNFVKNKISDERIRFNYKTIVHSNKCRQAATTHFFVTKPILRKSKKSIPRLEEGRKTIHHWPKVRDTVHKARQNLS